MWYQLWSAEYINQYDFLITGQSGFPLKLVNCSLGTLPQGISFAKPLHPAGFMLQGTHLCFLGIAQKLNWSPTCTFFRQKNKKSHAGPTVSRLETKKWAVLATLQCLGAEKGDSFAARLIDPKTARLIDPLIYIYIYISIYIYIYIEGFPQMVGFPNKLMGFSHSKWSFWAVKWGYHHLRKHPYLYRYTTTWYYSKSSLQNLQFHQFSPKKDVSLRRNNIPSLSLEMTATSLSYTVTLPVLSTYHI